MSKLENFEDNVHGKNNFRKNNFLQSKQLLRESNQKNVRIQVICGYKFSQIWQKKH